VRVGVTKSLTKFVDEFEPHLGQIRPQAHDQIQPGRLLHGGHGIGIQNFHTFIQLIAENIGIHSQILSPSQIVIQKSVRSCHGARGARLIGVFIHPGHPNQQLSQARIVSIHSIIFSIFWSILSKEFIKSSPLFINGDNSSLSTNPSPSVSLLKRSSLSLA
jgi:hypothetical protein